MPSALLFRSLLGQFQLDPTHGEIGHPQPPEREGGGGAVESLTGVRLPEVRVIGSQEAESVFAARRREASPAHTVVFGLTLLVSSVSFASGFVQSFRLFDVPPIGGDGFRRQCAANRPNHWWAVRDSTPGHSGRKDDPGVGFLRELGILRTHGFRWG